MATQTFYIDGRADSWDDLLGKRQRVIAEIKGRWEIKTIDALKKYKIIPITSFPCEISVHCSFKNKTCCAIGSIYFAPILDQLVKSGIFPGDSVKYIDCVALSGEVEAKNDSIGVTICSV